MGRNKDLRDFDKDKIVLARWLGQNSSETVRLVGCSWSAVVRIYQQWPEEGQITNWWQGAGHPRLIDAQGQWRLSRLVWANRISVAKVTQNSALSTVHCWCTFKF